MLSELIITITEQENNVDQLLVKAVNKLDRLEDEFDEELNIYKKLLTKWEPSEVVVDIVEKKLKELGKRIRELYSLKNNYLQVKEELAEAEYDDLDNYLRIKSKYNIYKILLESKTK